MGARAKQSIPPVTRRAVLRRDHHRCKVPGGRLIVAGSAPDAVSFRHADGSAYGSAPDPQAVDAQAVVFAALRRLGFAEGEARGALTEVAKSFDRMPSTAERMLREALARLTSPKG